MPDEQALSTFISTRLLASEKKEIQTAIKKSGIKQSEWLRRALLDRARNI
jgi:hypothetical protein